MLLILMPMLLLPPPPRLRYESYRMAAGVDYQLPKGCRLPSLESEGAHSHPNESVKASFWIVTSTWSSAAAHDCVRTSYASFVISFSIW